MKSTSIATKINILGTFVCDPIKEYLSCLLDKLTVINKVTVGPYNQIFQQLLLQPCDGFEFEVVLIRLEDWGNKSKTGKINKDLIEKNVNDFLSMLKKKEDGVFRMVGIVPASLVLKYEQNFFNLVESNIASQLDLIDYLDFISSQNFLKNYHAKFYDYYTDEHAHMPFTADMYTNIAAIITRKIYSYKKKLIKVIVLDCDNTLWSGVCGEDGPLGVKISRPYRDLQNFMLNQYKNGVLLCICSKNNEEDVSSVFLKNKDMILKAEHFICKKINWKSKVDNIIAISKDLNLGLDNFAFVDDNPVECAEVINNIPNVLTFNLPYKQDEIPNFLESIWDFDLPKRRTIEDQSRVGWYQVEEKRKCFKAEVGKLSEFINGLQLNIKILDFKNIYLPRVSQLSCRVNQFNFTTNRYSEKEIIALIDAGYVCKIVSVSDRFGDYGIVGVVMYSETDNEMKVKTFLLSCRVLGRGVEYNILSELGKLAIESKLTKITLYFKLTAKNQIVLDFLKKIGLRKNRACENETEFVLEAKKAVSLRFSNYLK
jgi:FkbH-like protein